MAEHYRHSGTIPIPAAIGTLAAGLIVAVVCGFVYSFAVVWIPFVYVSFLFTLGVGLLVGGTVVWRSKAGHIRSAFIPGVIGLLCGLVALYVAWGADLIARGALPENAGFLDAFAPAMLSDYVSYFYEHGFWSIGRNINNPVTGVWLAIVWVAEAAVIAGFPAFIALGAMSDLSYCETCGMWCAAETGVRRFAANDETDVTVERINDGDLRPLSDMSIADESALDFLRLDLARCPTCSDSNFLSLTRVRVKVDKKGERSESTETLVDKLLLAPRDVETVRTVGKSAEHTASPADSSGEASEPVFGE